MCLVGVCTGQTFSREEFNFSFVDSTGQKLIEHFGSYSSPLKDREG